MLRVLLFRNKSSNVLKLVRPRLEQKSEVVEMTEAAQGREDRNIFTHEYVSPQKQPSWSVWKKLNRQDCLRRRKQIEIPEFYVGSVIAVTYSHGLHKKLLSYFKPPKMTFLSTCTYFVEIF